MSKVAQVADTEGLPDAAERKRISERATQSLAEARALLERLERMDGLAPEVAAQAGLVEHGALPLVRPPELI
jgi:hypothetical protein